MCAGETLAMVEADSSAPDNGGKRKRPTERSVSVAAARRNAAGSDIDDAYSSYSFAGMCHAAERGLLLRKPQPAPSRVMARGKSTRSMKASSLPRRESDVECNEK